MFIKAFLSTIGVAALCVAPVCAGSAAVDNSDADFLRMAAEADMTAANIGQTAEDRANSSKVKNFAAKLVKDHTSDYQQVCEVATRTGETVPKAIDRKDGREIASVDRWKGKAFDREFLSQETTEHERLIRVFKQEAEHGSNPDIKAYATKALPVIQSHLHDAQDLLKSKV